MVKNKFTDKINGKIQLQGKFQDVIVNSKNTKYINIPPIDSANLYQLSHFKKQS